MRTRIRISIIAGISICVITAVASSYTSGSSDCHTAPAPYACSKPYHPTGCMVWETDGTVEDCVGGDLNPSMFRNTGTRECKWYEGHIAPPDIVVANLTVKEDVTSGFCEGQCY
jgi:hypothetical protein